MRERRLDSRPKERMFPTLVGARVPYLTGWGDVVSVFPQAVNILHPQGLLVSFIQKSRSMTALSLCVPSLFQRSEGGLASGDRVRFEGPRLLVSDLVVELLGKPTWQGTLTPSDVKGFRASKVSLLKEALVLKGREGGFLGLFRRGEAKNPFVKKAMKLLHGIPDSRSRSAGRVDLSGLVGLGPGATPAGDDFITGVLLGEEVLRHMPTADAKAVASGEKNMIACPIDQEKLWLALKSTNDGGRTLLWQALQGHFPEYLLGMLRFVSHAECREEIMIAVQRAVGCGATSGTEAVVGFLFCFERTLRNLSHPHSISKS